MRIIQFAQELFVRILAGDDISGNMIKPGRLVRSVRNIRVERRWHEVRDKFLRPLLKLVTYLHTRCGIFEDNVVLNACFSRVMLAAGQLCMDEIRAAVNHSAVARNGGSPARMMLKHQKPVEFQKRLPLGAEEDMLTRYNTTMKGKCAEEKDEDETGLTTRIVDPVISRVLRQRRDQLVATEFPAADIYRAVFTRARSDESYGFVYNSLHFDFNITLQLQQFEDAHAVLPDDADELNALLAVFRDAPGVSAADREIRAMLAV